MRKRILFGAMSGLLMACGADQGAGASDAQGEEDAVGYDAQPLAASASGAEDTYVATALPGTPRGARPYLRVSDTASLTRETYLKFAVTSLPANAVNIRATLDLYATATTSGTVEAHVAKATAWGEATLVLASAPGQDPAILDSISGTTAGARSSFDVSSAVKANGTVAIALKAPPGGGLVEYASKEAGPATAPALRVTYDVPPPAATTYFGSAYNPHSNARFDDLVKQWGAVKAVRSYDGSSGVTPFLTTFQAEDVGHGAISSFSFKYLPKEVLAGSHDATLRGFFNALVDDHPVYWTYWHEPDDQLYKDHLFTPAEYRAAWAHIKSIADSVKATRPRMKAFATLIVMEYSLTAKIAPSRPLLGPDGMYPGDDVIDVFGVDAYNNGADKGLVTSAATEFAPVIDFAQQHKKPWAIGELGSCPVVGNPNGRAQYLSDALTYWKSRQTPVFVTYFNVNWPKCDYRLDTDAAATKVWHDAVTTGYASF